MGWRWDVVRFVGEGVLRETRGEARPVRFHFRWQKLVPVHSGTPNNIC